MSDAMSDKKQMNNSGGIRIRTRYQRMRLAYLLAEDLKTHSDPYVQSRAQEITYALAAPMSTLNNVIDQFPQSIVREVAKAKTPGEGLLQELRAARQLLAERGFASLPFSAFLAAIGCGALLSCALEVLR